MLPLSGKHLCDITEALFSTDTFFKNGSLKNLRKSSFVISEPNVKTLFGANCIHQQLKLSLPCPPKCVKWFGIFWCVMLFSGEGVDVTGRKRVFTFQEEPSLATGAEGSESPAPDEGSSAKTITHFHCAAGIVAPRSCALVGPSLI